MGERQQLRQDNSNVAANMVYKVRISKGFVDSSYGEGFMVEVWDFRTQRLVYGERYKDLEEARRRQKEIRNDIDSMTRERFQQAYISRLSK
jgi:hypothetical protein